MKLLNKIKADIIFIPSQKTLRIRVHTKEDADKVRLLADSIVVSLKKLKLQYAEILYTGMQTPPIILCVEMAEILTEQKFPASLFVGAFPLTRSLLPHLDYILEHPEKKLALSRTSDNAQLVVSAASAIAFKSSGEVAVTRKTNHFWLSSDLEILQQMYRDYGGQEFELTYMATLNIPKFEVGAEDNWARFTTRYNLVEDDFGVVYRRGEILELVEVSAPAVVN